MQYMFLIYVDETSLTEEQWAHCYQESAAYAMELHARGKRVLVSPLQPTSTATSVRTREGKRMLTDGPFAETREQLGGYYLIEAKNLDEATAIAARIPGARFGSIEVRPVWLPMT